MSENKKSGGVPRLAESEKGWNESIFDPRDGAICCLIIILLSEFCFFPAPNRPIFVSFFRFLDRQLFIVAQVTKRPLGQGHNCKRERGHIRLGSLGKESW